MRQVILFKNQNGNCKVITPSNRELEIRSIEDIARKDIPFQTEWFIAGIDQLPDDVQYYDAWLYDGLTSTVKVDMAKARIIQLEEIKKARDRQFIELGFPVQLDPDLEAAIIPKATRDKLQALRDLPQTIDLQSATTPEELKAIWPEELT